MYFYLILSLFIKKFINYPLINRLKNDKENNSKSTGSYYKKIKKIFE
ncbi:hypothetical protein D925_02659 [Enterococcus faecalis B83616-1]|nr:hypothetical protein D925_02659 [Enterococcus faecalis B83616-1]